MNSFFYERRVKFSFYQLRGFTFSDFDPYRLSLSILSHLLIFGLSSRGYFISLILLEFFYFYFSYLFSKFFRKSANPYPSFFFLGLFSFFLGLTEITLASLYLSIITSPSFLAADALFCQFFSYFSNYFIIIYVFRNMSFV